MTTALSTEFLSGGFSIQRNEMVSMQQQKYAQKFEFLNSFNQTYTRLSKPAQHEFDRIAPYALSSQRRVFVGGTVTTVTRPLKQTYRNGNLPSVLGSIQLDANGAIQSINVLDGGFGYAPNTTFNVNIRGGEPTSGTLTPAVVTATSDNSGRIVSVDIVSSGNNYDAAAVQTLSAKIDESPDEGQFYVSFFEGVGALTSVNITSGQTGHRPGVYYVATTTTDSVAGSGAKFQVYVDAGGTVTKVVPLEFGETYVIADTITIPNTELGNDGGSDLVITVEAVTTSTQLAFDYGTVTWRSESFEVGDTVLLEYFIDTDKDPSASDGFLRTLAKDLCLHPYGNYYSSAFSSVPQRSASLVIKGGAVDGAIVELYDDAGIQFGVTDQDGFTAADDGKRIIEVNGSGTAILRVSGDGHTLNPYVATLEMTSTNNEESNPFTYEDATDGEPITGMVAGDKGYATGKWRLAIPVSDFEAQPYNIVYPFVDTDSNTAIPVGNNGQQNHRNVMSSIKRIGDMFVVESEKGTDLLSSKKEINSATDAIPTSVSLTQPVKDARKPQKWRMRFFYDTRDEYLYVNVATALQIKDNGDLSKGQGRDGIKQAVYRQPGELSEIYYNFSNDSNKAKSGFFRRQGKTTDDTEPTYPIAFRLTCTDHGTGLFIFDQASVDQDDDYAWFVVQRHVNNISGKIEFEDGKSPVHCLYSPSSRPEETSDFNIGFFAEVSEELDTTTGATTVTSKSLDELEIFDVNGRKLKPGLPVNVTIPTDSRPVALIPEAYGRGLSYLNTSSTVNVPLADHGALGTDSATGFTVVNDYYKFPEINAANFQAAPGLGGLGTAQLGVINSNIAGTARDAFALNFGSAYGSSFVPVGDYITGFDNGPASAGTGYRYDNVDTAGAPSAWTLINDQGGNGLKNYSVARTQMQGPAQLGLRTYRVRHRSSDGVDTFLDYENDFQFVSKTEVAPATDANGQARELPISSTVAIFTPTSIAAKQLVAKRRRRVVFIDNLDIGATTGTGANPILGAAGDFAGAVGGISDLTLVPITDSSFGGNAVGHKLALDSAGAAIQTGATGGIGQDFIVLDGTGSTGDVKVGDELTTATAQTAGFGFRVLSVIDTMPENDQFIYEYAWEGAGFNNEYTNFFGRYGTASNPLFEVNRLKVFVDGQEADAAVQGQNYQFDSSGNIEFGTTGGSTEYFGVQKPMYAYSLTTDKVKFNEPLEFATVVKISYENYNDVEERDTGRSTYLIRLPEDRDIPAIWNDIHKVAKGIYRFIVRENDVFKPWDYHVSAVTPQVDSPACINPVEQLSITQDKTVIFNFPTPLASQRFIYSDAEADLICIAGADSSTQGGIIKTSATKYDLDGQHVSTLSPQGGTASTSSNADPLNFRREYFWHNVKQSDGTTDAFDTTENSTHRTYVGMMSTKPFGNGMRIFLLTRGGPIRPSYSDYTPRDVRGISDNFPTGAVNGAIETLGGVDYTFDDGERSGDLVTADDASINVGTTTISGATVTSISSEILVGATASVTTVEGDTITLTVTEVSSSAGSITVRSSGSTVGTLAAGTVTFTKNVGSSWKGNYVNFGS